MGGALADWLLYIYIYPGVLVGYPPFSCFQVSRLSTCLSAGCPHTGSHCKNRVFLQSLEWTVEMWFGGNYGSGAAGLIAF